MVKPKRILPVMLSGMLLQRTPHDLGYQTFGLFLGAPQFLYPQGHNRQTVTTLSTN
jgi:hypothetical protein